MTKGFTLGNIRERECVYDNKIREIREINYDISYEFIIKFIFETTKSRRSRILRLFISKPYILK